MNCRLVCHKWLLRRVHCPAKRPWIHQPACAQPAACRWIAPAPAPLARKLQFAWLKLAGFPGIFIPGCLSCATPANPSCKPPPGGIRVQATIPHGPVDTADSAGALRHGSVTEYEYISATINIPAHAAVCLCGRFSDRMDF